MERLLDCWQDISGRFRGKHVFLFLDYDGTLAPIAATPGEAVLPEETRSVLRALAGAADVTVAIISGRALSDIKEKVALPGLIYVGNHGLEVEGPGLRSESPLPPTYRALIQAVRRELEEKLAGIAGVVVEDKLLTLSVHYRLARHSDEQTVREAVVLAAGEYIRDKKILLREGKKVCELRPTKGWDKGSIVAWLLARQHFIQGERPVACVYIGDDTTDEDAFAAVQDTGVTVFVGEPAATHARYTLKDTGEVRAFLEKVLLFMKDAPHGRTE